MNEFINLVLLSKQFIYIQQKNKIKQFFCSFVFFYGKQKNKNNYKKIYIKKN